MQQNGRRILKNIDCSNCFGHIFECKSKSVLDTAFIWLYNTIETSSCKGQSVNALIAENTLLSLSFEHHVIVELTW